ncbi:YbaB/EbfC family nucleoid-associated protein [Actinoplanes sp. G11-F43]|uniref:YbaB/EbfC family nucleoid-associated protein n=1 Tax=Actinoplanes sp. G11-F43 TaxID=3424130 RepID=UPI003D356711
MFDARGLGEAERLIDEWRGAIEVRASRARELSSRLALLTETARSPDGLVTVTVGAGGDLTGLDLGEGIRQRPATVTAREIMTTLRAARSAMVAAVTVTTTETIGADSATGRAVIETFAARFRPEDGCRD